MGDTQSRAPWDSEGKGLCCLLAEGLGTSFPCHSLHPHGTQRPRGPGFVSSSPLDVPVDETGAVLM